MKLIKFFTVAGIIMLLATSSIMGGSVSTEVSQRIIEKGQSVTVTVKAIGKDIAFSSLDRIGSYPISAPHINQAIEAKYINGKFSSLQKKSMQFTFFPEHNITIPTFTVTVDGKTMQTKPVAIQVVSAAKHPNNSNHFHLEMIASRIKVYVGESFALQVLFYEPRNSQVAQAQYVPPKFDGFFVKADQKEQLKQDTYGATHVFNYILTPQKEGNLTIQAPQIKLGIQTFGGARDPWGLFNNDLRWQLLRAHSKSIAVRPLPVSADLVGSFTLDAKVDRQSASVNKPVNYTLTIDGKGSLDDIEDPKFDLDDVTVYSNDAQVISEVRNGEVVSRWEKKYTFISDHNFTIPAIKQTIFDPKKSKTEVHTTQAWAIQILGGSSPQKKTHLSPPLSPSHSKHSPAAQTIPASTAQQAAISKQENSRSLLEDTAYYAKQAQHKISFPWWSLLVAFILGGVVMRAGQIIYAKIKTRQSPIHRRSKYTIDEALDILYPHTNNSLEIEAMVRELYQAKQDPNIKIDHERLGKIIEQVTER